MKLNLIDQNNQQLTLPGNLTNVSKSTFFVVLLIFLNLFQNSYAQIRNEAIGARSTALSGFSTTLSDVWSTNNNQAGLGFISNLSGGIFYTNKFLLKETAYKAAALVYPVKSGALGLNIISYGFELYNENKIALSYGQRFSDKFAIGVQMNYLTINLTPIYGNKSYLIGAIGLITKPNKELSLGVHIYNPSSNRLAKFDNERIPTIMKLGLSYHFSEKVTGVIATEKEISANAIIRAGIIYHIIEKLYLRGGVTTNPTLSSFGLGIQLKDFTIDISSSFHQTLGITPSISLVYTHSK